MATDPLMSASYADNYATTKSVGKIALNTAVISQNFAVLRACVDSSEPHHVLLIVLAGT